MPEFGGVTVAYCGNFQHAHCTEVHVAATLETIGCTVIRLQENETPLDEMLVRGAEADVFLYTRTWGLPGPQAIAMLRALEQRGTITASFHLDLYVGLNREHTLDGDPFWSTGWVFTPDGDPASEEMFAARGIRHVWSPPAVYEPECVPGQVVEQFQHRVVFVGSYPYPHAEWPYRNQLVEWLQGTYGAGFHRYGTGATTIRNMPLNDLYRSAEVVIGDSLCPGFVKPRYWCVDNDTEILTDEGWKFHQDIICPLQAYTINPDTGLGEWQPIQAVNEFPAERREMLSIEGPGHSSLTTLDHRWLTYGTEGRDRTPVTRFRTSRDLQPADRIPLAAPCSDLPTEAKFSDALVELVAWAWTEGTVKGDRYVDISQSNRVNGGYVQRIRAALTAAFGPSAPGALSGERWHGEPRWREVSLASRPEMTSFRLNRAASDEIWGQAPNHVVRPRFIAALTQAQLRLFVESSIDADGCRKAHGDTFAQKDVRRLGAFEMACALLGVATNRTLVDGCWIVTLKKRTVKAPLRGDAQATTSRIVDYEGEVWCPTTANGTWLARRRGSVYFTGNSDRITETLGRGGALVWPEIEGITGEGFVDGEHLRLYRFGDFDGLRTVINDMLDHPDETRAMADRGQAFVRANHTYIQRMTSMLTAIGIPPIPET